MEARPAIEVIRNAYLNPANAHLRLAHNANQTAVGSWDSRQNRFVMVASATITGQWVEMPYELLVNGKRIVEDWIEVPREVQS